MKIGSLLNTVMIVAAASCISAFLACLSPNDGNRTPPVCPPPSLPDTTNWDLSVVYPNGGEVFHPGDTVKARFGSKTVWKAGDSPLQIEARLEIGKSVWKRINQHPISFPGDSILPFVIPDSIGMWEVDTTDPFNPVSSYVNHSVISDTCRIKLSLYNFDFSYYDHSDCCFSIK
jgi:hypothetical protein